MQGQSCYLWPFTVLLVGVLAMFLGSSIYWRFEVFGSSCWKDACIVILMVYVVFSGLSGRQCRRRCEELEGLLRQSWKLTGNPNNDFGFGFCSHCADCSSHLSKMPSCNGCRCESPCKGSRNDILRRNGKCEKEDTMEGQEVIDEDEDIVWKLKKEIAKEKKIRNAMELELERERRAASWAADEALAKISRLQSEKWWAEMEANQERMKAEQNQLSYLWIIESLYNDLKMRGGNEVISENHLDS
ncbi:hypothetical protein J5N97_005611 [Dioscorea zingiberensis]|uniref:GTD-binding domain-containing protein n=1 Tax=Dioscorea zingiberensis TaxID=325984 RepID=A0A9D5HS21_9LILI|nr:hypothetical protein J5N97_005611 [Dioscorea zingiberensis]